MSAQPELMERLDHEARAGSNVCMEAAALIRQLTRERDEARADAARLDWIARLFTDGYDFDAYVHGGSCRVAIRKRREGRWQFTGYWPTLREAIDEARATLAASSLPTAEKP